MYDYALAGMWLIGSPVVYIVHRHTLALVKLYVCSHSDVHALMLSELNSLSKQYGCEQFEVVVSDFVLR